MNRKFEIYMNGNLEATFNTKKEAMDYSWSKAYLFHAKDKTDRWVDGWKLIMRIYK